MKNRCSHSRKGFTLLEGVLALGMVAALSVALYSALYTGLKARTIAQLQSADLRNATIAMDLVDRELQSVMMPTGTLAGPFIGSNDGNTGHENDSLDFYAIGSDYGTDSIFSNGFRHIFIGLKQNGTTSQLIRQVTRNLLTDVPDEAEEEILADNVTGFSIGYYDTANTTWSEDWDSTDLENALPNLIQVTIRIKKTDPRLQDQSYTITRLIHLPCGGAAPTSATDTSGGGA